MKSKPCSIPIRAEAASPEACLASLRREILARELVDVASKSLRITELACSKPAST